MYWPGLRPIARPAIGDVQDRRGHPQFGGKQQSDHSGCAGRQCWLCVIWESAAADGSTSGDPQEGKRRQDYWCSVKGEVNKRRPELW